MKRFTVKRFGLFIVLVVLIMAEVHGVVAQTVTIIQTSAHNVPVVLAPSLDPNPPVIQLLGRTQQRVSLNQPTKEQIQAAQALMTLKQPANNSTPSVKQDHLYNFLQATLRN